MTLVIEDGTGIADADSWATVDEADTYFQKRGVTAWAEKTTEEKEAALINSAEFISDQYEDRLEGSRLYTTQSLAYPRDVDGEFIPDNLKRAQIVLAGNIAINGDIYNPPVDETESEGMVTKVREKIGPLETETVYSANVLTETTNLTIPAVYVDKVTAILRPLFGGFVGGMMTARI